MGRLFDAVSCLLGIQDHNDHEGQCAIMLEDAAAFARGLELSDVTARPAMLDIADAYTARVTVTEGKYHQVRRMLAACGHETLTLHREQVGPLRLDPALEPGEMRELTAEELSVLRQAVELQP